MDSPLGGFGLASATPPPAPLEMPVQSLDVAPAVRFPPTPARVRFARLVAFGGGAAIAVLGYEQLSLAFGAETRTALQDVLLGLFSITFAWIALSATQALAGLVAPQRKPKAADAGPLRSRTALLMPVYHEDPAATAAALHAMGEALAGRGHGREFEIFILSDSRRPEAWLRETAAFARLRERLGGRMAVWYRRRPRNVGRKAGNLRDFVETWGGRYDYMLTLDADSLMSAETMLALVRRMDAAPDLGLLQTVPSLAGGRSLFARLQQFAGRLYGPVVARGVAAWQGDDGNYWGHNALIRTRAFARHCGLPELSGRKPFGGHILSHDFVEAALMRRGGWKTRMDPDLEGSWEGSPPTLLDLAQRDRRWAQGNLQHAKVLGARGLRLPSRIHFLIGIGAYLMSPVWLAMLLVGLLLTGQTLIWRPEYFESALQLFPDWPVFDAERMAWLFGAAMALLLLPKAIGLLRALCIGSLRRRFGGGLRLVLGVVLEVFLSALFAPVLMLMQCGQVTSILLGRDSGWDAQAREGVLLPWRLALRRHWLHVAAAVGPAVLLFRLAPDQLPWVAPVLVGLLLAPALSRSSGDVRIGKALRRVGLLAIPEERDPPEIWRKAAEAYADFKAAADVALIDLAGDPARLSRHVAALGAARARPERADLLAALTARAKIDAASSPEEAVEWLAPEEVEAMVGSPELLRRWASRPRAQEAAAD